MTHPIEAALKRKKRPSGRGRNFALTGLRNVTEIQAPSHDEEKVPAPKKGSGAQYLDDLLGTANRGGPDYMSPQKKKEDQRMKEEYDRRHGRTAEARKATSSSQPLENSTIPTDLQNIEVLQKLNQNLKKGIAPKNDSTGGRDNEYDPNDPLLPRSSRLNNILNKPPTAQPKVSCRVRFCDHQDFHIDWDPLDPDNQRASWTPRMVKYFDTAADHEDHEDCGSPDLVERSQTMARRILDKFTDIEDGKLSFEDKRQGKLARRSPSSSAVEREVKTMMLHVFKRGQTDQFVEKREQATGMNTNAKGNFVQGNRLFSFKPEVDGFAEPEKPRRVTKDPKTQQDTAKPKAVEVRKPKIIMKPMPKPKQNAKSKPKAHEMTAEERALLAGMKQAGAVELEKTIEAEHTAELDKQQEVIEPVTSEDQEIIDWLNGSPAAPKSLVKSSAKKPVVKKVEKAAADLPAADKGKRKLSTPSVVSNDSESSDGLTQAINDAIDAPFSLESIQKMADSKSKKRTLKVPPKPIKEGKRKASAVEDKDKDEEGQPKKKKGRKEYKSASVITASDDEDSDKLISTGSKLSVEDSKTIKESVKKVATDKTADVATSTKVTETVESTTTIEPSGPTKKRKLDGSTAADTTPPSTKKVKLTLEISEEAITPRSPPRKSPPRKTSSPRLSAFSMSPKRKTLAEQEDDEAVSPLSQPRSTPPTQSAQTTQPTSPESTGSKKRKTIADEEEGNETLRSPTQKKVKFTEDVVSPIKRPRKMSLEYITDAQNGETEGDDQAKIMDYATEATDKFSFSDPLPDTAHEVELNGGGEVGGDGDEDEDQDRDIDTFSVPDSEDSLFNDTG